MIDCSVIISTRNRAPILRATLAHYRTLLTQNLMWELIVVDNGSTDDTPQVLSESAKLLPLKSVSEPNPGKNRALNKALEISNGNLIIFTDDDILPCSRWLIEYTTAATRWSHHSIFCGPIRPIFPNDTPEWISDPQFFFTSEAFARYCPAKEEGLTKQKPFGGNLALRATLTKEYRYSELIGPSGSDYAMGSETELMSRLEAAGHEFMFIPTAEVDHVIQQHQIEFKTLLHRAYRHSRGSTRMTEKDRNSKYLFGVPRYMWRQLLLAWIAFKASVFLPDCRRFDLGYKLYTLLGKISEYREDKVDLRR